MKVKRNHKAILKTGVINGLSFAIGMAIFDWIDKEPFSILQFLFYFIFFGASMAFTFSYPYKSDD